MDKILLVIGGICLGTTVGQALLRPDNMNVLPGFFGLSCWCLRRYAK